MAKTVFYGSSSSTLQPIGHQLVQAKKAGFVFDDVLAEDTSASDLQLPFYKRETGKRLLDLLRSGDVLVCFWIDRFGKNYEEIQKNIRLFLDMGVTVKTVINGIIFDANPKDKMTKEIRDALLSFMSALAKAQAVAWREAQAAGIARAQAGNKLAYKGRKPIYNKTQVTQIMEMFGNGIGVNQIARKIGLNKFAVSRITRDHVGALAKLAKWEDQVETVITDEGRIPNLADWVTKYSRAYD